MRGRCGELSSLGSASLSRAFGAALCLGMGLGGVLSGLKTGARCCMDVLPIMAGMWRKNANRWARHKESRRPKGGLHTKEIPGIKLNLSVLGSKQIATNVVKI
jgi:hypothetical protein